MQTKKELEQPELELGLEPVEREISAARQKLSEAFDNAGKPAMVRVAPGKHGWIPADWAKDAIPQYVLCRWSKQPDGSYAPVPFPYRMVRMTPETTAMLGFTSGNRTVRYDTLLRLGNAGFIQIVRVSPNCWLIDLDSWFRHLADCMDDPEFWDNEGEARRNYNKANGLGIEHE